MKCNAHCQALNQSFLQKPQNRREATKKNDKKLHTYCVIYLKKWTPLPLFHRNFSHFLDLKIDIFAIIKSLRMREIDIKMLQLFDPIFPSCLIIPSCPIIPSSDHSLTDCPLTSDCPLMSDLPLTSDRPLTSVCPPHSTITDYSPKNLSKDLIQGSGQMENVHFLTSREVTWWPFCQALCAKPNNVKTLTSNIFLRLTHQNLLIPHSSHNVWSVFWTKFKCIILTSAHRLYV